jgi:hypothetical protein
LKNFVVSLQDEEDGLFYDRSGEDNPDECPPFLKGYETYNSKADMFCQNHPLMALITLSDEKGNNDDASGKIEQCLKTLRAFVSGDEKSGFCFERRRIRHGEFVGLKTRATGKEGSVFSMTTEGLEPLILLEAVSLYWEKSGSKLAEELIRGLANHIIFEGRQIEWNGMYNGHTHCGSIIPAVNGILTWALARGDEQYIHWAKRVLDWTLHNSSSFGWVPDGLLTEPSEVGGYFCETCSLSDTIQLALKLASAGFDEYWDTADRFVKNQLIENQYRKPENIKSLQKEFAGKKRVISAVRGAFESWSRPFYIHANRHGIEGCCTGSGVRALYAVWDKAVSREGQAIIVNLFIDRKLPYVEVETFEPEKGLLKIRVKEGDECRIRIPSFVHRRQVKLIINGRTVNSFAWQGNYLVCKGLKAGDILELVYPLSRKKLRELVTNAGEYRVSWLGNWVTGIEPLSGLTEAETDNDFSIPYPIYQRQEW